MISKRKRKISKKNSRLLTQEQGGVIAPAAPDPAEMIQVDLPEVPTDAAAEPVVAEEAPAPAPELSPKELAALVKELRGRLPKGADLKACKAALDAAGGDIEAAEAAIRAEYGEVWVAKEAAEAAAIEEGTKKAQEIADAKAKAKFAKQEAAEAAAAEAAAAEAAAAEAAAAEAAAAEAAAAEAAAVEAVPEPAAVEAVPEAPTEVAPEVKEVEAAPAAASGEVVIAAKDVKKLRDATGAGMMDCKKALKDSAGDMNEALEFLRKKGLAIADKKASRKALEGVIETYIHTGAKLGVMVEVNCETDFVARQEKFQDLARNIAMQIAACPDVEFISQDDISQEFKDNEIRLESQKEDLLSKPEEIRSKIAEGRVAKLLKTKSLLDQSYIRDGDMTVGDLMTQSIAVLGENIKIARFDRMNLGETAAGDEE